MTTQHTPTPWRVEDGSTVYGSRQGKNDKFEIADCKGYKTEREANAAFIVRACNAHDALIAALEKWKEFMECNYKKSEISFWDETQAAIAKAKGKP